MYVNKKSSPFLLRVWLWLLPMKIFQHYTKQKSLSTKNITKFGHSFVITALLRWPRSLCLSIAITCLDPTSNVCQSHLHFHLHPHPSPLSVPFLSLFPSPFDLRVVVTLRIFIEHVRSFATASDQSPVVLFPPPCCFPTCR